MALHGLVTADRLIKAAIATLEVAPYDAEHGKVGAKYNEAKDAWWDICGIQKDVRTDTFKKKVLALIALYQLDVRDLSHLHLHLEFLIMSGFGSSTRRMKGQL